MSDTAEQAELADAFRAETRALAELDARIGRRMRERQRLEMAFDAIAAAVDATLARGEAPLALVDELDLMDQRLQRLEHDLTAALESAAKSL
jgi:hypothetical protein